MSGPQTEIRRGDTSRAGALALSSLVSAADALDGVRRSEIAAGDRLLVSTRNSIYSLVALADGRFRVSGGCYSRGGECTEPEPTLAVNGCTAGGHAIFTGIIAAPGLFLELGDGTRTTRIRRVRRIPGETVVPAAP